MKKIIWSGCLVFALLLAGCSSGTEITDTKEIVKKLNDSLIKSKEENSGSGISTNEVSRKFDGEEETVVSEIVFQYNNRNKGKIEVKKEIDAVVMNGSMKINTISIYQNGDMFQELNGSKTMESGLGNADALKLLPEITDFKEKEVKSGVMKEKDKGFEVEITYKIDLANFRINQLISSGMEYSFDDISKMKLVETIQIDKEGRITSSRSKQTFDVKQEKGSEKVTITSTMTYKNFDKQEIKVENKSEYKEYK